MSAETPAVSDRWMLVTGGSKGIGRAIVQRLVRTGHEVVFTYKSSEKEARELETSDRRAVACRCDGSDPGAVARLADVLLAERGAPGAVINNMGIARDATILNMELSQWESVLGTNLGSAYSFTHAFAKSMIDAGGGVFIQMSSVTAIRGNKGQTNYGTTKAGLIGFTKSLSVELARFNVRANAVLPGFIKTEMLATMPETMLSQATKLVPLRRLGEADEVAALVEYLVSPVAAYITGQTFVIDGGLTA